jgi:hypothetical protein
MSEEPVFEERARPVGREGREVGGSLGRVGDGIRTRDIQIHNLVP